MQLSDPTTAQKAELRRAAFARRDALPAADRAAAAATIAARPFPVDVPAGAVVSGFSPMRSEINPVPLMRALADRGARLALPVVQGRGRRLLFREWAFGQSLVAGVWGIREPGPEAPVVEPDVVIVPMAAFDRRGHRIGYGAGYYDMTLSALRAAKTIVAAGIAFAAQEIDAVPDTPRDEVLDLIMTERDVIVPGRS